MGETSMRWVDLSLALQRVLWAIDGELESSLLSGYRGSLERVDVSAERFFCQW